MRYLTAMQLGLAFSETSADMFIGLGAASLPARLTGHVGEVTTGDTPHTVDSSVAAFDKKAA